MAQQHRMCLGLLVSEVSRSHSDTPYSVGLLWKSDWPVAKPLPDNNQHSKEKDIHVPERFETATAGSEWPHVRVLDRVATSIGRRSYMHEYITVALIDCLMSYGNK
jgi:hypothetical protein